MAVVTESLKSLIDSTNHSDGNGNLLSCVASGDSKKRATDIWFLRITDRDLQFVNSLENPFFSRHANRNSAKLRELLDLLSFNLVKPYSRKSLKINWLRILRGSVYGTEGFMALDQLSQIKEKQTAELHGMEPKAIKTLHAGLNANGLDFKS